MEGLKNNKGVALVLALVLLVVLSVLAVGMVFLSGRETRFLLKGRLSDAALYIADGGVEYAINQLRKDTNYRGPENYVLQDAGEFRVSVSVDGQPADHYEITSTGYVPDATNPKEIRTIKSVVNITEELAPVFQYAIASRGNITLQGNAVINSDNPQGEGDIYSGGNILLQNNATVNGDAAAVGTITTQGNATITGERTPGSEPLEFPQVDTARYISEAQQGGTYNGNYIVSSNQNLGPLYINGNLVIQGNYQVTLTGTVYVAGSVTLQGTPDAYSFTGSETLVANGNITMQGNPSAGIPLVISVNGNVTLQGSVSVQGSVIYAPQGTITVQGNPDVTGVLVGNQVIVQGSATVTRQMDLTGYPLPGGGTVTADIVSWQEL